MNSNLKRVAILTGTTASGKTSLALEAAEKHALEIINADSLLVYRGMDIGTAKPSRAELERVPHHLIDIRNPDEAFNAAEFARLVNQSVEEIHARGKRAIIVGGTGFYLKALIYGVWEASGTSTELRSALEKETNDDLYAKLRARDVEAALRIGMNDRYRLIRALEVIAQTGRSPSELEAEKNSQPADPRFELWIVDRASDELFARIRTRAAQMLKQGLLEEVKRIRDLYPRSRALSAVGYRQVCDYFDGTRPESRAVAPGLQGLQDEIELATRQLVKKQRTWFRGQHDGTWFTLESDREKLESAIHAFYEKDQTHRSSH